MPNNNNISLRILCANCDEFPIECVESTCCYSIFCNDCTSLFTQCPNCYSDFDFKPNVPLQRLINEMEICCRIPNCNKIVKVGSLLDHESICIHRMVECPYSDECERVVRKDLESHLLSCPHREISCPNSCGNFVVISQLEDHFEICDELLIECPNKCGDFYTRKDHPNHLRTCGHALVPCEYSKYGCPYSVLRNEYEKHCQEFTCKHLRLMCLRMRDQQDEIDLLRRDLDLQKSSKTSWKYHEMVQAVAMTTLIFSAFPILFSFLPNVMALGIIAISTNRSILADSWLEFTFWMTFGWFAQFWIFGSSFVISVISVGMFVLAGRVAIAEDRVSAL